MPASESRMTILLNGQPIDLPTSCALDAFIAAHVPHPAACAVAVNGRVVPRSQHAERIVADGDQIEVVRAVGGG